ncbi:Alpha-soluble NSF attachment protein [Rhynchospora pubera]|uniref:Alpha-soluble NSF attachment protein n=1 Tax=Rhynchospora pubera TaxID=906938 RepID=A0AAV8FM38_9POAL|nr:Alpha-soluble NSF attachment protein [Rhynchospora pubera]KAJ4815662.1 Alpha-soluble NSF attachment protein [Rhynchospora pubera]
MADFEAKGDDFEKKAEKKLTGWGLFGSKYDDAADLFDKAANQFKLAKNWSRAANAYIRVADCHLKLESKHEAASAYVEAANSYKKISTRDAAQALNQAVNLYMEMGRLNMAARYCKDLGEMYEQDQDLEKAIDFFERAGDLFMTEEGTTSANQCRQRVAQIAAQLEDYTKATKLLEEIAKQQVNNNLLKYSAKGTLLNAGICQLCRGDPIAIANALERYQDLDPTFSGTREYRLLADLATSMDEGDIPKFTEAIREFDSMTRLDPWKTTLLLRAKKTIQEKDDLDEDLT